MGAQQVELAATFVVSLVILMFFSWKRGKFQSTLEPARKVGTGGGVQVRPMPAAPLDPYDE